MHLVKLALDILVSVVAKHKSASNSAHLLVDGSLLLFLISGFDDNLLGSGKSVDLFLLIVDALESIHFRPVYLFCSATEGLVVHALVRIEGISIDSLIIASS